jgi:hypothetical protein
MNTIGRGNELGSKRGGEELTVRIVHWHTLRFRCALLANLGTCSPVLQDFRMMAVDGRHHNRRHRYLHDVLQLVLFLSG